MTDKNQHTEEQLIQMRTQLRGVDALLIAHFASDTRERQESQRLLHQIWSLCFLGYNTRVVVGTQPAPEPSVQPDANQVPSTDEQTGFGDGDRYPDA